MIQVGSYVKVMQIKEKDISFLANYQLNMEQFLHFSKLYSVLTFVSTFAERILSFNVCFIAYVGFS